MCARVELQYDKLTHMVCVKIGGDWGVGSSGIESVDSWRVCREKGGSLETRRGGRGAKENT